MVLHALPETVFSLSHYFIFLPKHVLFADWPCMIILCVSNIQSIIKVRLRFVIYDTAAFKCDISVVFYELLLCIMYN